MLSAQPRSLIADAQKQSSVSPTAFMPGCLILHACRLPAKQDAHLRPTPSSPGLPRSKGAGGKSEDGPPGSTDARVDVTLRSMLSPSRAGSSPRFKKAADVV